MPGKLPIASAHNWSGFLVLSGYFLSLWMTLPRRNKSVHFPYFLLDGVIKITYMKSRTEGKKSLMDKLNPVQIFVASTQQLGISRKWANWIIHETKVKSIHLYLNQILYNSFHCIKYAGQLKSINIICKQRRKIGNMVSQCICNVIVLIH